MILIYSRTCTPCKYRSQLSHIKLFACSIRTEVKIIETLGRPDLEAEAKQVSDIEMPFVHNTETKTSKSMTEVSKGFTI
jgi:hypothetical protein